MLIQSFLEWLQQKEYLKKIMKRILGMIAFIYWREDFHYQ